MSSRYYPPLGSTFDRDPWMVHGDCPQSGQSHVNHADGDYALLDYQDSAAVSMELAYTMPRPPSYAATQLGQTSPQLVVPQHHRVWPSTITASPAKWPRLLPTIPTGMSSAASSVNSGRTPAYAKATTSRRKLTDDDRRLMCLEAENNPAMKQSQIGAKFDVERSTVSKILRQKARYMKPQVTGEVTNPREKQKTKLSDVEKTLHSWARRNQQDNGLPVTPEELHKQVLTFTSGRSDQQHYTSAEWLESFREKYLAGDSRSSGHEDTTEIGTTRSEELETTPTSSNGFVSPSVLAIEDNQRSQHEPGGLDGILEFEGHNSEGRLSPISPAVKREYRSPSSTENPLINGDFSWQRSMILSHLAADSSPPSVASDRPVASLPVRSTTLTEGQRCVPVDARQTVKRHKSVSDVHDTEAVRYSTMQPPRVPRSTDTFPVSVPSSPSQQDESMRALHHIKMLLEQHPDIADSDDYVMIGKLMAKLDLLQRQASTPVLFDQTQPTVITDSPRLSKKRTVVEMSL